MKWELTRSMYKVCTVRAQSFRRVVLQTKKRCRGYTRLVYKPNELFEDERAGINTFRTGNGLRSTSHLSLNNLP